jgi:hypothetical protein
MITVVGLDISKGKSQVQAFLDKNQPYKKVIVATILLKALKMWFSST